MMKNMLFYKLFLICSSNMVAGIFTLIWFSGEVASPLIIFGGSSAIFFLFFAHNYEERALSLFFFFFNNIVIFYLLERPNPCCFLVGLILILLTACHLYLFLDSYVFLHFIFFAVLLSRIFFNQKMGEWGFGLVTELIFIRLFIFFLKKDIGSRIEPVLYLIPLFLISFLNLLYLDYGLKEIIIHINFLFAAAVLLFFLFFSESERGLLI